ncbi:hypothetical protein [Polaromonas sp. CG9_12]|nr:hypothetical protein [Polaromonas sp. CG9_12]
MIQTENAKPGSPDWELTAPSSTPTVEGYASHTSVNRGETIRFFVNTSAPTCTRPSTAWAGVQARAPGG